MSRELTEEHKAALRAGRVRRAADEAARKAKASERFHAWVVEDARLWAEYAAAAGDKAQTKAREAWKANMRLIPDTSAL